MTTYYVASTGGDNGNDGLSAANAWKTLEYADAQVSAGDTVWLSPGLHRVVMPWVMTTTGTSGNVISYKGDFLGVMFSTFERGEVVITATTRPDNDVDGHDWAILWSYIYKDAGFGSDINGVDLNVCDYIEWYNIHFEHNHSVDSGSHSVRLRGALSPSGAFYGSRFTECFFYGSISANNTQSVTLVYAKTDGDVPSGEEVVFERCMFVGGGVEAWMDESPTVATNMHLTFEACIFTGRGDGIDTRLNTDDTYESGGLLVSNCTFAHGINSPITQATTHKDLCEVYNCVFCGFAGAIDVDAWGAGQHANVMAGGYNIDPEAPGTYSMGWTSIELGGRGDMLHRILYGWSPWLPWELITKDGGHYGIGAGVDDTKTAPTYDFFGNLLDTAMGIGFFTLTGTYEAGTAPGWSGTPDGVEIFDEDIGNSSYDGASAAGVVTVAGADITNVSGWPREDGIFQVIAFCSPGAAPGTFDADVEYLAEALITAQSFVGVDDRQPHLMIVPDAAGGMTRDVMSKLRFRATSDWAGSGNAYFNSIVMYVEMVNTRPRGAISNKIKLMEESTIVNTPGGKSGKLETTGAWQKAMYLATGLHTFTVYARKNSTYTGTAPMLEFEVPETGASNTDSLSVGADTWEQLSVNLTLTEARTVVLRLYSYNTAKGGYVYFDDLVEE